MTDRDYTAWMAVRAIGEAATRTQSIDPDVISIYMRGDRFQLAGYKGSTARGTGSCASRFYWPMLAR